MTDIDSPPMWTSITENNTVPVATLRWMGGDNATKIQEYNGSNAIVYWRATNTEDNRWYDGGHGVTGHQEATQATRTLTITRLKKPTETFTRNHTGLSSPVLHCFAGNSGTFQGGTTFFVTFSASTLHATAGTYLLSSHNRAWLTNGLQDTVVISIAPTSTAAADMNFNMFHNSASGQVTRYAQQILPFKKVSVNVPVTLGVTLVPNTRTIKFIGNINDTISPPVSFTYSTSTPVIREKYAHETNSVSLAGQLYLNSNGTITTTSTRDASTVVFYDVRHFDRTLSDEEMMTTYERMVNAFQDPDKAYNTIIPPTLTW